jgi:mevalonate kinase
MTPMTTEGSAPGKIILSGEYAVLFGEPGLLVPSVSTMRVRYEENPLRGTLDVLWEGITGGPVWNEYLAQILSRIEPVRGQLLTGTLTIENQLPLGKGMGSSTALVIACCRALLGDNCEEEALRIEDQVNPGHSGADFAAIWANRPILFHRGQTAKRVSLPADFLHGALLIDTGTPGETTPELVTWVREREAELTPALRMIAKCAGRLLEGEDPLVVIRDHHRAQTILGIVPEAVQACIAEIERAGGAAKVIGAGGRTGGAGMVLVLGIDQTMLETVCTYPVFPLQQ